MTRIDTSARYRLAALVMTVLLTATLMGCTGSSQTPGATRVQPIETLSAFDNAINGQSGHSLVMVDFYADWCPPCKELAPVMDALSVTYADRVAVYKVDVDKMNPILERFGITAIPYVMFFKDGRPIKALSGLQPKSAYSDTIKSLM